MSAAVTDLRLRRGAEHLCRLGPRAVAELLAEIGAQHGIHDDLAQRLAGYQRLSQATVQASGADRFPPFLSEVL